MQLLETHIQTLTLVVLALTALAIFWQAIEARKLARVAVRLVKLSLEQTQLVQTQVHATFRPIVTVTGGTYGPNIATLTLQNVGTGPALSVFGSYRSKATQSVGSLSANEERSFAFHYNLNLTPQRIGPPAPGTRQSMNGTKPFPSALNTSQSQERIVGPRLISSWAGKAQSSLRKSNGAWTCLR